VVLLILASGAGGQPAPPPPATETDTIAETLRDLLPAILPSPLYEDTRHWGLQRDFEQVHWRGKGLNLYKEVTYEPRNDGRWWRVKVTASDLERGLTVGVYDLRRTSAETLEFSLAIGLETHLEYDRQTWSAGTRLYAGSIRARARAIVNVRCEATVRLDTPKGKYVPDVVLQFRLLAGDFQYDNVKIEHLPGFGGDAAKILGEALLETLRIIKPSLERKMMDKAHEAIAKAGQAREVRLSLSRWIGK
jgi:hypothetical protein